VVESFVEGILRADAMKPRVYLETTIPSYLTARPSRDLVRAAHQQIPREWWEQHRAEFDLYISQVVVRECQGGDPEAAAKRLDVVKDLPLLEETTRRHLAEGCCGRCPCGSSGGGRAAHCRSAVHGMNYLVT